MAMTRLEAEDLILEKLKEIREIALEYSPEDDYLNLFILGGHCSVCNGKKPHKKLDVWEDVVKGIEPWRQDLEEAKDAEDQT